jgi:hypothetical protein
VQGGSKLTRSLATYLSALQFDARDMPRLVHRLVSDRPWLMALTDTWPGPAREWCARAGTHAASGATARRDVG